MGDTCHFLRTSPTGSVYRQQTHWLSSPQRQTGIGLHRSTYGSIWNQIGLHQTTSGLNWVPGLQIDCIGPTEIHLHLKNICILITQTHSQSSCDLTDPQGWIYFWKLALTCTPDPLPPTRCGPNPNRPTRCAILRSKCSVYVWCGPMWSNLVRCSPILSNAVISHTANNAVHIICIGRYLTVQLLTFTSSMCYQLQTTDVCI